METYSRSAGSNTCAPIWSDTSVIVDWLDRDPSPRMVIDAELRIMWSNASARTVFAGPAPVFVRRGTLCFEDPAGTDLWKQFFLSLGGERVRSVVHCADGQKFAIVSAFAREVEGRRLAFVTISPVARPFDLRACGFVTYFNLTVAEAQVAQKLVDLLPPPAIAQALSISINTVRSHIRKVYAKVAVSSQTELLRLAHSYCQT